MCLSRITAPACGYFQDAGLSQAGPTTHSQKKDTNDQQRYLMYGGTVSIPCCLRLRTFYSAAQQKGSHWVYPRCLSKVSGRKLCLGGFIPGSLKEGRPVRRGVVGGPEKAASTSRRAASHELGAKDLFLEVI